MTITTLDTRTVRRWKRYPEYRQTEHWFAELPAHWRPVPVKHTFRIVNGATPQSSEPNYWDGDIPWATPEDLGNLVGDTLRETGRRITASGYDNCGTTLAPAGSLVLSTRAPIGHLAISGTAMCTNQGCRTLVFKLAAEIRFFYYVLRASCPELQSLGRGSTFVELSRDELAAVALPVPPLPEQKAIAAFLDRETARINALIGHKERLVELLEEKRQAVISHAVTRGLDPTAPLKDSGIPWLGNVPKHWKVQRIKWVAKLESGHTPDKKVAEYWTNCDIPWVSLNDTGYLKDHDYISETAYQVNQFGLANSSARLLPARAVVFSRDATIGRCAITTRPMAVSQHFIAWLCRDSIMPEYLLRVLRAMQQELERLTMGATIKTIGMPDVRTLTSPVPPLPEQEQIVRHIEEKTAAIDKTLARIGEGIERLQEYRTALISAAVTGQIDVRGEVAS